MIPFYTETVTTVTPGTLSCCCPAVACTVVAEAAAAAAAAAAVPYPSPPRTSTALSVFAAPLSQLLERIGLDAAVAATYTLVVAFPLMRGSLQVRARRVAFALCCT